MAAAPTILDDGLRTAGPHGGHLRQEPKQKLYFYRPELDALRFAAFLTVFLHHGIYSFSPTFSRFGAFGLSLFFLLSAFLITELLQREKDAKGSISIRSFYVRRSLRIWPLYYGFLLLTWLIGVGFPGHQAPWAFFVSFCLMVGNVYVGRNGFPNNAAGFLWSISVEEQFYLLWPLLNQHCSRRTLQRIAIGTLPLGSLTILILASRPFVSNLTIWTNALVEFQMFAWGVLLSLGLRGRRPNFSYVTRSLFLIAGVVLWIVAARWSGVDDQVFQGVRSVILGYYMVGAGCAAIFLSVYGVQAERVPRPVVYLGRISYGLYVFHALCLDVVSWVLNHTVVAASATHHALYGVCHVVLGLVFTIAISALSYRYFETPFLKMKDRFATVHSRAV